MEWVSETYLLHSRFDLVTMPKDLVTCLGLQRMRTWEFGEQEELKNLSGSQLFGFPPCAGLESFMDASFTSVDRKFIKIFVVDHNFQPRFFLFVQR